MDDVVIQVEHVAKKFKIFFDKGNSLKERTLFKKRNRYEEHHVLRDVSFCARKGKAIGLIGENGCGKSTMLKLLSRIMTPDSGSITMKGRISCLIELGAGFHPDMSGRENIYTNAAIFGLSREEIEARVDEIIRFSELGEYIDNPVRTYSSGMYMRLAFAVAINVDADILLVDEILAVGDASFQVKCFNKLQEIKNRGTTIVIVSHSLGSIEQFCDRTYWICDGLVRMAGKPRDVHPTYLEFMATKDRGVDGQANEHSDANRSDENPADESDKMGSEAASTEEPLHAVVLEHIEVLNEAGNVATRFCLGESIQLSFMYDVKKSEKKVIAGLGVYRADGLHCYGTTTWIDGMQPFSLTCGKHKMVVSLDSVGLLNGSYHVDWALSTAEGKQLTYVHDAAQFTIYTKSQEIGAFQIPHHWMIEQ